jgi:hypothetical protein
VLLVLVVSPVLQVSGVPQVLAELLAPQASEAPLVWLESRALWVRLVRRESQAPQVSAARWERQAAQAPEERPAPEVLLGLRGPSATRACVAPRVLRAT